MPRRRSARRPTPHHPGGLPWERVGSQTGAVLDRLWPPAQNRRGAEPPDLLAWARDLLPHYVRREYSAMHRWLAARLDALREARGSKLNVLGPRGGAKSTIVTVAYVLREAVEGLEPYIWIVSDSKPQAHGHLENLKAELTGNPELALRYPASAGRGPVWRAGTIRLRNGVAIEAFGTLQPLRGRRRGEHRPSLVVCDDLQSDRHAISPLLREQTQRWFHGTLLRAGSRRTNFVHLATALHREALALELLRTPGWTNRVFRAIERWPDDMALWAAWEAIYSDAANPQARAAAAEFYAAHRAALEAGAVVLWPEEEDLLTLMQQRAESGHAAFEREMQNAPVSPEQCEWPESWFNAGLWFVHWPEELDVRTMALDPSKGADARRGDYSAYVLLGVDRERLVYLEADLARRPTPTIVADGVALWRRFRPDAFGIEANQYQELLAGEFAEEFQRQGLLPVAPWLLDNHVRKAVRIRRLGPLLAARRLRFKADSPSTRLLVEQMRDFPHAPHDDGPDAAEMALRLALDLLGGPPADDGLGNRLEVG
jgi:predicted phage terminase large subunit-like protein